MDVMPAFFIFLVHHCKKRKNKEKKIYKITRNRLHNENFHFIFKYLFSYPDRTVAVLVLGRALYADGLSWIGVALLGSEEMS